MNLHHDPSTARLRSYGSSSQSINCIAMFIWIFITIHQLHRYSHMDPHHDPSTASLFPHGPSSRSINCVAIPMRTFITIHQRPRSHLHLDHLRGQMVPARSKRARKPLALRLRSAGTGGLAPPVTEATECTHTCECLIARESVGCTRRRLQDSSRSIRS